MDPLAFGRNSDGGSSSSSSSSERGATTEVELDEATLKACEIFNTGPIYESHPACSTMFDDLHRYWTVIGISKMVIMCKLVEVSYGKYEVGAGTQGDTVTIAAQDTLARQTSLLTLGLMNQARTPTQSSYNNDSDPSPHLTNNVIAQSFHYFGQQPSFTSLDLQPKGRPTNRLDVLPSEVQQKLLGFLDIYEADELVRHLLPHLTSAWLKTVPKRFMAWFNHLCSRSNVRYMGAVDGGRRHVWRLSSLDLHPGVKLPKADDVVDEQTYVPRDTTGVPSLASFDETMMAFFQKAFEMLMSLGYNERYRKWNPSTGHITLKKIVTSGTSVEKLERTGAPSEGESYNQRRVEIDASFSIDLHYAAVTCAPRLHWHEWNGGFEEAFLLMYDDELRVVLKNLEVVWRPKFLCCKANMNERYGSNRIQSVFTDAFHDRQSYDLWDDEWSEEAALEL